MNLKKVGLLAASFLLIGSVAISATACSSSSSSKSNGETLTVSTFGLSTKQMRNDVLNPFSKESGVTVKTQFGDSSTRLTQIEHNSNSNIDVIELAQNNAVTGNKKKLFKKLDFSKISNFKYLTKSEQKLARETNAVPYTVNSIGIIYNPKKVKINDWKDLWDNKLKGKLAIPDITTTFGPAMLYLAGDYSGTSVTKDDGASAFKAMEKLKPNILKTYTQSSDLSNMFKSGEIDVAVVGDYAVSMLQATNPDLKYTVPTSGTYANYDNVAILKNSKNSNAAYKYINFRISKAIQKKVASSKSLNNAPVNTQVKLTPSEATNKTYGSVAKRAKTIDFSFVNKEMPTWISKWNKIMNH